MHNSGLAFNMILQKIRYTPNVLRLAAEMILETATRHGRRRKYNLVGGLLRIVMCNTYICHIVLFV